MVGDISDGLRDRVRTYLDETTAGFWTDTEIFASLTDGQNAIISQLMGMWKQKQLINFGEPLPQVLTPVIVTATLSRASAKVYTLPSDYLYWIAVADPAGLVVNVREQSLAKVARALNTYTKGATGTDFCAIGSTVITEATDSASLTLTYIKSPSDMTTDVDPTLTNKGCYAAMVQYAFADLLKKDEKYAEAFQEFQKFLSMVIQLYV